MLNALSIGRRRELLRALFPNAASAEQSLVFSVAKSAREMQKTDNTGSVPWGFSESSPACVWTFPGSPYLPLKSSLLEQLPGRGAPGRCSSDGRSHRETCSHTQVRALAPSARRFGCRKHGEQ